MKNMSTGAATPMNTTGSKTIFSLQEGRLGRSRKSILRSRLLENHVNNATTAYKEALEEMKSSPLEKQMCAKASHGDLLKIISTPWLSSATKGKVTPEAV